MLLTILSSRAEKAVSPELAEALSEAEGGVEAEAI